MLDGLGEHMDPHGSFIYRGQKNVEESEELHHHKGILKCGMEFRTGGGPTIVLSAAQVLFDATLLRRAHRGSELLSSKDHVAA